MSRRSVVRAIALLSTLAALLIGARALRAHTDRPDAASPTSAETSRAPPSTVDEASRSSLASPSDKGRVSEPRATASTPDEPPITRVPVLTGVVLDRATRAPIVGAAVSPLGVGEARSDVLIERPDERGAWIRPPDVGFAVTDAAGAFRLPLDTLPAAATCRLCVRHATHVTGLTEPTAYQTDPAARDGIEVFLDAGATIEGTVAPPRAGATVKGRVYVDPESSDETRVIDLDAVGHYRISGVAPGHAEVGFAPWPDEFADEGGLIPRKAHVLVEAGETRRVDFAASFGCTVEVTVRRGAEPARASWMSIDSRGVEEVPPLHPNEAPEGGGRYVAHGVPAGPALVTVCRGGHEDTNLAIEVVAGRRNEFTLTIPTTRVHGHVQIRGSSAIPSRIAVRLFRRDERGALDRIGVHWTNSDGTYEFADVPGGRYALVIDARDLTDGDDRDDAHVPSFRSIRRDVELADGTDHVEDFVAEPAGGVTVKVLDPAGRPMPQGVVTLVPAGAPSSISSRWSSWFESGGLTGTDGTARMRGLEAGRYVAYLDQSEFADTASEPVDVAPGVESVTTITTQATERVRVLFEFRRPDGTVPYDYDAVWRDVHGAAINTAIPHARLKAQAFAILAPGSYSLHVEGDTWEPVDRTFEVKVPSPQRVRVVLSARPK